VKPIRQPGEKQTIFENKTASASCMDVKQQNFDRVLLSATEYSTNGK
jgi:hypothetical protein